MDYVEVSEQQPSQALCPLLLLFLPSTTLQQNKPVAQTFCNRLGSDNDLFQLHQPHSLHMIAGGRCPDFGVGRGCQKTANSYSCRCVLWQRTANRQPGAHLDVDRSQAVLHTEARLFCLGGQLIGKTAVAAMLHRHIAAVPLSLKLAAKWTVRRVHILSWWPWNPWRCAKYILWPFPGLKWTQHHSF